MTFSFELKCVKFNYKIKIEYIALKINQNFLIKKNVKNISNGRFNRKYLKILPAYDNHLKVKHITEAGFFKFYLFILEKKGV
jgi:hypothetical protein